MKPGQAHGTRTRIPSRRGEQGFALLSALLITVLITGLASAAMLAAQMDLTVAGNYRAQRAAEVAADGGLELIKAMIYGNEPTLNLPLGINSTWAGETLTYGGPGVDEDIWIDLNIRYKLEDNINFNATETYTDEVVRYGKDYNYLTAPKDVGKQPVYTVTFTDHRTGTKGEADLISAIGFRTPAAIFAKGKVKMYKWGNASQERIEVTSGTGTPAVATTLAKASANVFIQTVASVHGSASPNRANPLAHDDQSHTAASAPPWGTLTSCYTHFSYTDQSGGTGYYDRPTQYYDYRVNKGSSHTNHSDYTTVSLRNPVAPPWPPGATGLSGVAPLYNYVFDDLFTDTENTAAYNAGNRNLARDRQFILVGTGNKALDLDGAANATAAKAIFNFDKDDAAVVKYNYVIPTPGVGTCPSSWSATECMLGAKFTDFREVADTILTGNASITVPDDVGGTYATSGGLDMSGTTFGTEASPQIVYFNSNMNDTGGSNGNDPLALVTNPGTQMQGYGILIINGDVKVFGSINWKGLMLVRGNLFFRPWQGGNWCNRSDSSLASNWDGFIVNGGDLDLLSLAGGTILLGYGGPGSSAATIKGIISGAIQHKILSWRRSYN